MNDKKIIIIVGPSGSGKTSIGERLEKKSIPRLITTTTRPARSKEQEGVDYYFRKLSEMEISDFVEQTKYHNNRYGLTKAEIEAKLEKHDLVHVSLDKSGAKALKE
ncbi:MAG: guanylate kinase, partial [Atopostipes suicloacalis]|nr:guanylate kinase [Atopostipes suicloacalis]